MTKVAVLGGSFDPPHLGHFWIAKQILEIRKDIEKVILMPVNKHQWKTISASTNDRLEMLKYHVSHQVEVSDLEIKRQGVSYTEDTLKELKKTHNTVYWIVGSDILGEYEKWDKKEELLDLTTFLVFPRDPYLMPDSLPKGFEQVKSDFLITSNISSTKVKERIKVGYSIKNFVLPEVKEYIKDKNLYQ